LAQEIDKDKTVRASRWLEKTIKALSPLTREIMPSQVYFSPGKDCRDAVIQFCIGAKSSLDICVFTISDDRISAAIHDALCVV
jgi:cardiolipin hydrolase